MNKKTTEKTENTGAYGKSPEAEPLKKSGKPQKKVKSVNLQNNVSTGKSSKTEFADNKDYISESSETEKNEKQKAQVKVGKSVKNVSDLPHFKNDGRLRLLIIVGTRPEIIRLSAVIRKCRKYFDCLLAHTGQNYDYNLSRIFFDELGTGLPDIDMKCVGDDLGETVGNIISSSYKLMEKCRPDALLILGDTNSCLSAISAKRLHIPIFHMEAGNRCKDECLPEETNRRIVDIISDVNIAYSENARRNLAACGLPSERTFVVGSPMPEVLENNFDRILSSDILKREGLSENGYILLSVHREENIDSKENFETIFGAVNKLAETYRMPILYSCHPRSMKRLNESGFVLHPAVRVHQPLGFIDYNCLQMNAFAVISDSGTLPEESSYYISKGKAFAAVSLRSSTERQEAVDAGCFILSGIEETEILRSVQLALEMRKNGDTGSVVPDYTDKNVSTKTVRIIQSYITVVNKFVWRK